MMRQEPAGCFNSVFKSMAQWAHRFAVKTDDTFRVILGKNIRAVQRVAFPNVALLDMVNTDSTRLELLKVSLKLNAVGDLSYVRFYRLINCCSLTSIPRGGLVRKVDWLHSNSPWGRVNFQSGRHLQIPFANSYGSSIYDRRYYHVTRSG